MSNSPTKIYLDSVEVYKERAWVKYPSTNMKRASASVCWEGKYTYLAGGVVTNGSENTRVNTIEKWDGTEWKILNVCLLESLISPGTVCVGNGNIVVLGGQKGEKEYVDTAYVMNLEDGNRRELDQIKICTKCTYAQVRYEEQMVKFRDFSGNYYEFEFKVSE